ncbi:DUF2141 domain-containing protein [Azospirillum brasilense]|uniref:DUF2141 domain-containing protein n=1 Tax=Azospirillum brasilense TaxID=192 RepID=A0A6L3AQZ6_AZOBR|nr:DUF2141 domain-containing protein [Azospirillum brasilense]KAA0676334.1 DUF2141 domain-containing protein [Azospirillum brasilense]
MIPWQFQNARRVTAGGWLAALAFGLATAQAAAADLAITVANVANAQGKVLVAVCTPETFLGPNCPYTAAEPARPGSVTVVVHKVPPGTYAVQAFHDENQNLELDRNFLGLPKEGIGFSNDAPMHFGPPRYTDATLAVAEPITRTMLTLRYLIER